MAAVPEPRRLEELLGEVKRAHQGKEVVNVEEEKLKVFIFDLGGRAYAFLGSEVKEIVPHCEIFDVPSLPEYLPGLINVRGDIESAVDIAFFLGVQRAKAESALIAMVEKGSFRSGIIIDAVRDVADVLKSALLPPLATLDGPARELAAGEIVLDGHTATLLDLEKLAARVTL